MCVCTYKSGSKSVLIFGNNHEQKAFALQIFFAAQLNLFYSSKKQKMSFVRRYTCYRYQYISMNNTNYWMLHIRATFSC